MQKLFSTASLLLWANLAIGQQTLTFEDPYLNDYADLLQVETAQAIRAKLVNFHRNKGVEFIVVTIDRMSDHGTISQIEPFATEAFNRRGIGDADRNDGVLLLVSRFDRVLRIEVGSGYGLTLNKPMEDVIDDIIVPNFKRDHYDRGIARGVDEIIYAISGSAPGESVIKRSAFVMKRFMEQFYGWIIAGALTIFGVLTVFGRRLMRYVPKHCPNDKSKMILLTETDDDRHLSEGEISEERVKSIDYDIWICTKCDHVKKISFSPLFSKHSACRNCNFKTAMGESTTITSATRSSSGQRRIDYLCGNCGDFYQEFKVIPRITSSSRSGGSSSGGSSSGGGASGSW